MEPNKLEKDFKQKLDQREIQPSEMAWDRLDAMLSVTEKKKPRRTWMYVAAGFLGFILTGTIFFRGIENETEIKTNNAVVIEQQENKNVQKQILEEQPESSSNITVNQGAIASHQSKFSKTTEKSQTQISPKEDEVLNQPENEAIVISNPEEKIQKPNRYIESDQLLAEAETKLQTESIKQYVAKSSVKVSSKSLLSSVESELDESFRDKIVKSISKNYRSVRSTLETRNNE